MLALTALEVWGCPPMKAHPLVVFEVRLLALTALEVWGCPPMKAHPLFFFEVRLLALRALETALGPVNARADGKGEEGAWRLAALKVLASGAEPRAEVKRRA